MFWRFCGSSPLSFLGSSAEELSELWMTLLLICCWKTPPPETSRPLRRIQKNSTPGIAYLLLFRRSRHRFSELRLLSRLLVLQFSSAAPHLPRSYFIPHISLLISKGSYFYFNRRIVSPMCQRQSGRSSSSNSRSYLWKEKAVISQS